MSSPASEWSFDLGFPRDYVRLPLDLLGAEDEAAVDAGEAALVEQVNARLADEDDPGLSSTAEELLPLLWELTVDAYEGGAVEAAVHVLDLPDACHTSIVRVHHEELEGPPGHSSAVQAATLARRLREPQPGDVTSRAVEVVDLPGGPSVRVAFRADDKEGAQAPGTLSLVLEVLQHWFPIAGQPAALVIDGRTAFLTEAEGMVEDLDRIAASVRLHQP